MNKVAMLRSGPNYDSGAFLGTCFSFRKPSLFLTAAHCVDDVADDNLLLFGTFAGPEPRRVEAVVKHDEADLTIVYCPGVAQGMVEPFTTIGVADWGGDFCAVGFPVDTSSFGCQHWSEPVTSYGPTARFFRGHFQRWMSCHFSHLGYKYCAQELSIGAPAGLSGGPVFSPSDKDTVFGLVTENRENSTHLRTITEESSEEGTFVEKVHTVVNYAVCLTLHEHREWLESMTRELCGV